MSRKRNLLPDIYKPKKRPCLAASVGVENNPTLCVDDEVDCIPSDTKASLLYLKGLFPVEKFENRLPPIILKHQVYSVVKNRTVADKQLADLKNNGEIRLFKLGADIDDFSIIFTDDYREHVHQTAGGNSINKSVADKFLETVVKKCNDVSISNDLLVSEFHFKDEEITQLVKACLLTVRDVGSWWISIPNTSIFMKNFIRGRKTVLTIIRKTKYREIYKEDLEQRKWPRLARLGIMYHVHDIIGADLVECIPTTTGQLLRLKE